MPQSLTEDQIKSTLQGISIPPQPQIMVDLQMEQMSPDCSMQQVSKLISQDVGLSGSILKAVNSPFFGLKNKITSVQQAINLLGLDSVINIVNALSIRSELSDEAIVAMNRFWDSAMDIANAAAFVAKQLDYEAPDEAYILGLFHNCGIALLMLRFDNYGEVMRAAYAEPNKPLTDIEDEMLKTNHAVVGYYVAKSWKLPDYICNTIEDHHFADRVFGPASGSSDKHKSLMAILKLAEHACASYQTLGNTQTNHEFSRIEDNLLSYVDMSQYDLQNLIDACEELGFGSGGYIKL